jgi:serine/threonine protein kinase/WD40 repeat protein
MGESSSGSDLFDKLAHEFAERYRHGERPALSEYTDRFPDLAEEIRELFPALVAMEQFGDDVQSRSDHAAGQSSRASPMPEQLGDYRIVREIGRGGMGIVYEAVQQSLGRRVALKVLSHDRPLGPVQLIRFEREARAAALMHHSNIVPIFGVGEDKGFHYYAMQYIQGQSVDAVVRDVIRLRRDGADGRAVAPSESDSMSANLAVRLLTQRLGAQPLTADVTKVISQLVEKPTVTHAPVDPSTHDEWSRVDERSSSSSIGGRKEARYFRNVARLGVQAAEALAYAHGHGILHRDIKPANLLLDRSGTIWVTDFGLAKADGTEELTSPGDVVGTLRYLAPERFQGKADARSDIYSLGLTLYEMVTFKRAFPASQRAHLVRTILHDEPAHPRKLVPQIPRDLETIILKAIAKNPSDRFATAGELARDLGRFVAGRPIHCRRVFLPERIWRWSQRNRAQAVLALLAMLLTCILVIGSTAAAWTYRKQRNAVQLEEHKTRAELGRSLLLRARATRHSRQPGRRSDALQSLRTAAQIAHEFGAPAEHLAELRDEAIAALALTDDQIVQVWQGFGVSPPRAAYSIDADRYVVLGSNGSIHVHRLSDRSELRVMGLDRPLARYSIRFVPGGRFVCVEAGAAQTELWDLERGEVPAAWPADVRSAVPRADGKQVAALRSSGELQVYDLPAATLSSRCLLGVAVPSSLAPESMSLAENGRHLALIPPDQSHVCVYEVSSGRVICDLKTPSEPLVEAVALSRDARLLAVNHDRAISVHEVGNGEQLALLQGHHSMAVTFAFQPAGDLLTSQSWDGTTRLWDPLRGRLLVTLWGALVDWAGSGSQLAIVRDQDLTLHQLASGDVRRTTDCRMVSDRAQRAGNFPLSVAYSPDGQLIASSVPPGVVVIRASDGLELAFLPIGPCDQALFLSDETLLTYNERGLCRWPVRPLAGGRLRLGPPEPLGLPDQGTGFEYSGLAASASGRLVGVTLRGQGGAVLLDADRPWRRTWLTPHEGASSLAISPDGRWAATTGRATSPDGRLLKVWDAATGKLLVQIPVGVAKVAFSLDGRWLGVGATRWFGIEGEARYRFFRTGSWAPGPEFDHGIENGIAPLAFHPSGRIAAIRDSYLSWIQYRSRLRIVDLETGGVLAALEAPEDANTYEVKFSPDGRFLAAAQTDHRVDVWDLSRVRSHLEELGVAPGIPDLFAGTASADAGPPVQRIEVEGIDRASLRLLAARQTLRRAWFDFRVLLDSDLTSAEALFGRGIRWARMGQWRLAAADYTRAFIFEPPDSPARRFEHAVLCAAAGDVAGYRSARDYMLALFGKTNAPAWLEYGAHAWVIAPEGPEAKAQALQLAEQRASAMSNRWSDHVLGLARYRAGHFKDADAGLQASLVRDPRWDGHVMNWLVIAMTQKQLGHSDESLRWLDRAETWVSSRVRGRPGGLERAVPENWHWRDGILLHLLLNEARAVIGQRSPDARPGRITP